MKAKSVFYFGLLPLLLSVFVCNGNNVSSPADANDEDAVYHLVTIGKVDEFNFDLLDFSIPDTLLSSLSPVEPSFYWYELTRDSLGLTISLDYPNGNDTLGTVASADVKEIKFFFGTFEIIGTDTTGGGSNPVRLSKEFEIRGEINAQFAKFGSNFNYRRGWLLSEISDVEYTAGYPGGITQITLQSDSYPEHIVVSGMKPVSDVLEFAPGESLTVIVNGSDISDLARIRYPSNGTFQNLDLDMNQNGEFTAGFRVPENSQKNHFLVEVISSAAFEINGLFKSEAIGILFEIE